MGLGWIKAYREWLDDPLISKDPDHIAVWLFLNLNATHKDVPVRFKGKDIILKPGQLLTGRKEISDVTGVSESKVHRVLKEFSGEQQNEQQNEQQSEQLIEQQTSTKGRLISLLNWKSEQKSEQQSEQQNEQQNEHLQECNKKNKEMLLYKRPTREQFKADLIANQIEIDPDYAYDCCDRKGWSNITDYISYVRGIMRNMKKSSPVPENIVSMEEKRRQEEAERRRKQYGYREDM